MRHPGSKINIDPARAREPKLNQILLWETLVMRRWQKLAVDLLQVKHLLIKRESLDLHQATVSSDLKILLSQRPALKDVETSAISGGTITDITETDTGRVYIRMAPFCIAKTQPLVQLIINVMVMMKKLMISRECCEPIKGFWARVGAVLCWSEFGEALRRRSSPVMVSERVDFMIFATR